MHTTIHTHTHAYILITHLSAKEYVKYLKLSAQCPAHPVLVSRVALGWGLIPAVLSRAEPWGLASQDPLTHAAAGGQCYSTFWKASKVGVKQVTKQEKGSLC